MNENKYVVINPDRTLTVPESLKKVGVQHDHMAKTVTFKCPKMWGVDVDLSELIIYINYKRHDGIEGCKVATNVRTDDYDDNLIYFDWEVTGNVTGAAGKLEVLVCGKRTDENGLEEIHWNSEKTKEMFVSPGLEVLTELFDKYPDIITDLLMKMEVIVKANGMTLDKSLSIEGLASDAAAVGEVVNGLSSDLEELRSLVENGGTGGGSGSTIIIDKTLTKEGQAADSKAVGDSINAVNKRIDGLDTFKHVICSQSEYDALTKRPNNVIYMITG